MLNISKYCSAIAGCSAIAAISFLAAAQPASAQSAPRNVPGGFNSNSTGGNTTTNPKPPIPPVPPNVPPKTVPPFLSNNLTERAKALLQARQKVQELSVPTRPRSQSAQRFSRVGDAADCGCPNADTVGSEPTTPANSAELEAAKAAEAAAAEQLAAAKAEARQFIEEANKPNAGSTVSIIW